MKHCLIIFHVGLFQVARRDPTGNKGKPTNEWMVEFEWCILTTLCNTATRGKRAGPSDTVEVFSCAISK